MANPVKAAKTVRKARQAAEAAAKAKATAEAAAKAKAAAETASKARTAATAATKAEAAAKAAEGAKTASGAASAADRAEKLAARAERMASRSGAREAVAKARARAQGTAAAPAAPAAKPAAAPAAPAAKPAAAPAAPGAAPAATGEDWTFFRNMKQSRGYDQSKWNRMLKDATNPADVQAHARGFGFSMTEDQAKQVLAWRDTQKAGNTPAWQRMTSPTPTSTPSTPRTGSNPSRTPAPGSRGSTHTPPRSSAPSSTPPASGAPAAATPDTPERLSFVNSLPFGKGWKAETKGVPRSNWAKAAATAGAIYAGDKLLNTGLDPNTGGAVVDAFTQVPKGPGDSFIGTAVANLFAGLQTGATGRPSGLAPTRGQYDGWSPELVASLPGIQKAVAERTALAAALKQASEVPDMSPTALNGLLGQIRKSYDEGMALTNGLVGADLDKMTEHHTNVYRQRLGMLQNLPAMKELVKDNANRVAQMASGVEGLYDTWSDEDKQRVQPYVDWFNKQPIENQVFFDFEGYQKALDSKRAAGGR